MRLKCLFLSACLMAPCCALAARADDLVVVGLVGKWKDQAGNPITFGMKLADSVAVVRDSKDLNFGSITLVDSKDGRVTFACDDPATLPTQGCSKAIPVKFRPQSAVAHTESGGIWKWVNDLLPSDPHRYYSTVSRDAGTLQDGVVKANGNTADLKPVFGSLNKGDYQVDVQRLQPDKPPVSVGAVPARLHWDPATGEATGLPAMPAGLYQIRVQTTDGEQVGDVWALVVPPDAFPEKSAAFAEVTKTTAEWTPQTPASGVRAVNRAALDHLSR